MSSKDIYQQRVKDVMSRDVVSIHVDETLHEALQLMVENRVGVLPVVDKRDHCVGVLSTSDLVDVTRDLDAELTAYEKVDEGSRGWLIEQLGEHLGHERVDSLMSENVATVTPDTMLVTAAQEMLRNRVHRLPVVDQGKRLAGIVSTMDVMSALVNGEKP